MHKTRLVQHYYQIIFTLNKTSQTPIIATRYSINHKNNTKLTHCASPKTSTTETFFTNPITFLTAKSMMTKKEKP